MDDFISAQDQECRIAFDNVQALVAHGDDARIQALYDRYRIWGESVGASHSGRLYKRSLDYRLREAPRRREQILHILKELRKRAGELQTSLVSSAGEERPLNSHEESGEDEEDTGEDCEDGGFGHWTLSDSDESTVATEDKSRARDDAAPRPKVGIKWLTSSSRLEASYASLELAIDCLYKLPVRHPASFNRFGNLLAATGAEFDIYAHFDRLYVDDVFPHANKKVAKRLALLITQRRRILRYRKAYNEELRNETDHSVSAQRQRDLGSSQIVLIPSTSFSEIGGRSKKAPSSYPESSLKATTFRPDRDVSLQMAHLLAGGSLDIDEVSSVATTTIEKSHLIVPDPPMDDKGNVLQSFQCPYCGIPTHIVSKNAWRQVKHIFRDLEPYVCTFKNCFQPDTMYNNKDEWFLHESQHFKEYSCGMPDHERYDDSASFVEHMSIVHEIRTIQHDDDATIRMFERSFRRSGGQCNLCGAMTDNLKHHLGRHLERIAIFALPRSNDPTGGNEDQGSHNSNASLGSAGGFQKSLGSQVSSKGALSQDSPNRISLHSEFPDVDEVADALNDETWQYVKPELGLQDLRLKNMEHRSLEFLTLRGHLDIGDHFTGRVAELGDMAHILRPGDDTIKQRCLVLAGPGGIGKTQLAIAYARRHKSHYGPVLWLDASSEPSLKADLRSITYQFLLATELDNLDDTGILTMVFLWLSNAQNVEWLLIFDNYDDPNLYDIEQYLPHTAHGSIIVTTCRVDLPFGQQMRISPFKALDESLEILRTRSRRDNVQSDPDARRLAERLDGLPLALATAGAYLLKSTVSFEQYLDAHEREFNVNSQKTAKGLGHQDRLLYTTWGLSYKLLEQEDKLAAQAFRMLGYFDNQQIWYELLHGGIDNDTPSWLYHVAGGSKIVFESIMDTLVNYGLVETDPTTQSYSMHNHIYDWTMTQLNVTFSQEQYWYAVNCVAASLGEVHDWTMLRQPHYGGLARHALCLAHDQFLAAISPGGMPLDHCYQLHSLANLLAQQMHFVAAQELYIRALAGKEQVLGSEHSSTLITVQYLGHLYRDQGKLDEAEQMMTRVLAGQEKALGPEHPSTLDTIMNLGLLYRDQGKLVEAEQMMVRALVGQEKALGPEHPSTLDTIMNLGLLYHDQGKLVEAEQMMTRVLAGQEKALGPEHPSTLDAIMNLGILYRDQGKRTEAEQMMVRALAGREKALGPEHTSTLDTLINLGNLYRDQGRLRKAEQMCERVLAGREKALGPEHISTLDTVNDLSHIYRDQGKLIEAEQMCERALAGHEKVIGPEHVSTLTTIHDLGILYVKQGRLREAEQMYERALAGREKVIGPEHVSTLTTIHDLGILYVKQGRLKEAEQMYERALTGREKVFGPEHTSTLNIINHIGHLYRAQGKLLEAEQMYIRALTGYERALGKDHPSTQRTVRDLDFLHQSQSWLDASKQLQHITAEGGSE